MHRIQTGGGPTNPKKEDPLDSKIISLIRTSAVGLFNHFDNFETELNEIQKTGIDSNKVLMQDWSDYTPETLRTPVAKPLQKKIKTELLLLELRQKQSEYQEENKENSEEM
ncbi:unnamed protein product [Parnassius apollo]|uniref:(apollo) hypothetical protein n=1 Tax=Parnassius apollo TaxID=110799 RepID=A0A8S3WX33_PARAO|nr:unnamed protein product [Parnassius apollo]